MPRNNSESSMVPSPTISGSEIETAESHMPYGFGGGQWTMPRGSSNSAGSCIVTNGVEWCDDGTVIDSVTRRNLLAGQEDC